MLELKRTPSAPKWTRQAEPSWLLPGVFAALGALGLYVYLFRLTVPTWLGDEIAYARAGREYLDGIFNFGMENPLFAKFILGQSQSIFGESLLAIRLPAAVAGLATGVLLGALAYRVGGGWAAALAFAIWCLMPRPELIGDIDIGQVKIDRYARLEVFMGAFAAAGLFAGWRWIEAGRLRFAVVAGACIGLAATSKPPGMLFLPAILIAGLVSLPLSRRTLLQAAAAGGACLLAAAATYLPIASDAPNVIKTMFDVSEYRNQIGHPFVIDGELYTHPPWWTNVWWQWKAIGTPATTAVVTCLAFAPFVLRRGLWVLLVLAVAIPVAYLSFGLDYALPYYYYAWQAPLLLLCALVLFELARRGGLARVGAVALAIPFTAAAVGTVADVSRIEPRDYAAAARELEPELRRGTVVTWELEVFKVLEAELPGVKGGIDPRRVPDLAAIIVDPTTSTRRPNAAISTYLREHRSEFVLRRADHLRIFLPR